LGILFSCVSCQPSYLIWTVPPSSFFMFLLAGFDSRIMQVCGDIMGPESWESLQGLLVRCQARLLTSFNGIGLRSMEDCAPSAFSKLGFGGFVFVL
jgi:hypothetical protein